jgi:hypothetical protein
VTLHCNDFDKHRRFDLHVIDADGRGHCLVCSPASEPAGASAPGVEAAGAPEESRLPTNTLDDDPAKWRRLFQREP